MECVWEHALLKYQDRLPQGLIEAVHSHDQTLFLRLLTEATIDPQYTDLIIACCGKLLAHVCVSLPQSGPAFAVVAAYGRIIPLVPYLTSCAVEYLEGDVFDITSSTSHDLTIYLLGLLRLLRSNLQDFIHFVQPSKLSTLLEGSDRTNIYLALRILQLYLHGADHWFEQMFRRYLGEDTQDNALHGPWDAKTIDYRFLSLWEESRQYACRNIIAQASELVQQTPINTNLISTSHFDHRTIVIGHQLLLRDAQDVQSNQRISLSQVPTTVENLRRIAQALQSRRPLLISGPAGSGKSLLIRHTADQLRKLDRMVTLHLNEQSDAKLLVGIYTSGETPGSIIWKPGVLTTAVQEGRWVLIENIDRAPEYIIGALLPLIKHRVLTIPNRKQTIYASEGFRLIATTQASLSQKKPGGVLANMLGRRHWHAVDIDPLPLEELTTVVGRRFPNLNRLLPQIMSVHERVRHLNDIAAFANRSRTSMMRQIGPRELLKWCTRIAQLLKSRDEFTLVDVDDIFLEGTDCFVGALPDGQARDQIAAVIAEELRVDPQRRDFLESDRTIKYHADKQRLVIGRYVLDKAETSQRRQESSFSTNPYTLRIMERIAAAVVNREPLLLVGETGVGKTTSVQYLASQLGKKLVPFNLSQQSEVGDILGGFKPVNIRSIVVALQDDFEALFNASFSHTRNQQFLEQLGKFLARSNWKAVCKLWRQALKMVDEQKVKSDRQGEPDSKRRKVTVKASATLSRWEDFARRLTNVEGRLAAGAENFAFAFVEGNIVKALRNGDWVLLDEINLASSDTLEALTDLLESESPSVLLTEAGNIERVTAHPGFRVFAAMNPATDVGKKDLPLGVRSRFTELYVESPDKDLKSLQAIVASYLRQEITTDPAVALDVSRLYQSIIALAEQNKLVDGAGQRPHFSLRTLTRTLSYAKYIAPQCNLRRALYEGFQMSFMTFLEADSSKLVNPLLEKYLFRKRKEWRTELRKPLRMPESATSAVLAYPGSKHWIKQGMEPLQTESRYIITPFVERNLENLVRAASTRQFPVLIQGPTSSGKTSMIEYLAKRTGHRFVRINNHEHTDLQEYLGTYVSTASGRLEFQEGVLVKALREGHWIVLDELNLAPTDVLEALNRLLDDNRELLIPETQEVVRPHDDFMLFATQNPAGLYGGRKTLSRAFRNRFLELHFDDIPVDELQEILQKRNPQLPDSRCKLVVDVYQELALLRQQNRLFEQKSFATLRDLFRWAMRTNETIEQLAANGFMLLAERVRKSEDREMIKDTIEKVMSAGRPRVTVDESALYNASSPEILLYCDKHEASGVVWTKAMRRLFVLVARAIENNEPVLLVGDTGCGKTTVCQMLADAFGKTLHIVNAHQNTETGDLIGSQRPVRNRAGIEAQLRQLLMDSSMLQQSNFDDNIATKELLQAYEQSLQAMCQDARASYSATTEHAGIQTCLARSQALFEWVDGSLIEAMKEGSFFLLDEISLADDSVLERLNSVLESSRSVLLAEKGSVDAAVTAQDGFQFLATMNPGGDYGKRELSPALRNRFTEIWVPSISDPADIISIIEDDLVLEARKFSQAMLAFAQWFKAHFDVSTTSGLSIREILAWKTFINAFAQHGIAPAVVHGAAMVYIDTLGANPAGLMSLTGTDIHDSRSKCLDQLSALTNYDCHNIYNIEVQVSSDRARLLVGLFAVPVRNPDVAERYEFNFAARTTRLNTLRVVRALQLAKPILLEGKPGVGKTALITALANHVGVPLTRINLSEQTDLIDLFGADAPVEGAETGTFAWRDAPFLRSMKAGHWVLLDEMNLASQSILEGLNAVLDHRGKAFIPELGITFDKHPEFRLFAAQNPHHQGGGRKGLPASFVNRFTVVYADSFQPDDLTLLSAQAFPAVPQDLLRKIVSFVQRLETDVSHHKKFGASGAPWEFNLRDVTKWLQLLATDAPFVGASSLLDAARLLFSSRFRTSHDRAAVNQIFRGVFGDSFHPSDLSIAVSSTAVQIGYTALPRHTLTAYHDTSSTVAHIVKHNLDAVQMVMMCVQRSWPVLLSGPSGCGKSQAIAALAAFVGAEVETCALNSETDAMDLIGGYEQLDAHSDVLRALDRFDRQLESIVKSDAVVSAPIRQLKSIASLRERLSQFRKGRLGLEQLRQDLSRESLPGVTQFLRSMDSAMRVSGQAHFSWVDGVLVDAMQQGKWLVLENANLCSPSVLDRLNSLLERQGTLILNEHVEKDGSPKIIQPHVGFRIFLLSDTKYGELSRAMRNRAVEIYLEPPQLTGVQCWPVCEESAVQRFRLASITQLFGREGQSHSPDILSMMGYIGLADQHLVSRFLRQIESGLYSICPSQEAIQQASYGSLPEHYLNRMRVLVTEAVSRSQLPADFARVQTVHPLNNLPLLQQDQDLSAHALQLGMTHDIFTSLSSLSFFVDNLSSQRPHLSRLLRVERQVFDSARTANTTSESALLTLIAQLVNVFRESLLQSDLLARGDVNQSTIPIYIYLSSLHVLIKYATSQNVEAQVLSTCLGTLRKLSSPFLNSTSIQDVLKTIPDHEQPGWGALCRRLWWALKPNTPRSEEQYHGYQELKSLVSRFDQTAFRFEQPVDQLVNLRLSLQRALCMFEGDRQLDLTAFNASIDKVLTFEHASDSSTVAVEPHFILSFKRLARDHTIKAGHFGAEDSHLRQQLSLMAKESTIRTSQQFIGQSAAAMPSFALLWDPTMKEHRAQLQPVSIVSEILQAKHVSIRRLDLLRTELAVLGPVLFGNSHKWCADDNASLNVVLNRLVTTLSSMDDSSDDPSRSATQAPEYSKHFAELVEWVRSASNASASTTVAARMWLSLAVHFLRQYVPAGGIDPAAEIMIERQVYQDCHDRMQHSMRALTAINEFIAGRSTSFRVRLIQDRLESLPLGPADPGVYRPATSQLSQLSTVLGSLRRAVPMIEDSLRDKATIPLDQPLIINLWHIRSRLDEDFAAYKDFTGPIIYFLDCLMVGQYLATQNTHAPGSKNHDQMATIVPLVKATLSTWLLDETFHFHVPSSVQHKYRLLWLSALAARSSFRPLRLASSELLTIVEEQFGRLYEAWRLELTIDQKQHAAQNSLYKYEGVDDMDSQEAIDAQEELFPTFDKADKDANVESDEHSSMPSRTQQLAARIAKLHYELFSVQTTSEERLLSLLVESGSAMSSVQDAPYDASLPLTLASAAQLHETVETNSTHDSNVNFYKDQNLKQISMLHQHICNSVARFKELHDAWPEHATPKEVMLICDEILDISHTEPIPKFLPLVERLYSTFNQWQGIASSDYSVAALVDATADLIVSWRRLELSSWSTIFDDEDRRCKEDASSWWFTAYETIIVATAQIEDNLDGIQPHLNGLVVVLKEFLEACGQGEYATRLQLLRNFTSHLSCTYRDRLILTRVAQALSNVTAYYGKYEAAVVEQLAQKRKKLGAEIKDVIQLASWKDRNIDSLRQSAKASHKKLFRIVRKYRNGLAEPVTGVINAGLPALQALPGTQATKTYDHKHPIEDAATGAISAWTDRPRRYQNVAQTISLMREKLDRSRQRHIGHERLSAFIQDIGRAILELRKATPSLKKDENEALIGHLKNRKRRLLADVLRELRIMGLQHNMSQDLLQSQSTLPVVLSRIPYVDTCHDPHHIKRISQDHLFRLLNLMPSVRECARKHSDDLTNAEAARCTALLESVLDVSLLQQHRINEVQAHTEYLCSQVALIASFADCSPTLEIGGSLHRSSLTTYRSGIAVARTCIRLLHMHSSLTATEVNRNVEQLNALVEKIDAIITQVAESATLPGGIEGRLQLEHMRSLFTASHELDTLASRIATDRPELMYLMKQLRCWLVSGDVNQQSINKDVQVDPQAWTTSFIGLLDDILAITEQLDASTAESTDESMWLRKAQVILDAKWSVLCNRRVLTQLVTLIDQLPTITNPDENLPALSAICRSALPLLTTYADAVNEMGGAYWSLHSETARLGHTLATSFIKLAREGFCTPSDRETEQQGQSQGVESGTGLGDGEGGEDISKDIKDNEDLSELAQEPNKEDTVEGLKNEKDAVDMADEELEGQTQDADAESEGSDITDQEEIAQEDMEEEVGSVNDDTANALDEKMWDDGKAEDQQDKEASNNKGTKGDEIAAAEDGTKPEDEQQDADEAADDELDQEGQSDNGDNVERPDMEGVDPHLQEQENLELPEDMNMDGQSVADDGVSSPDIDFEDASEMGDIDNAGGENEMQDEDVAPDEPEEDIAMKEAGEEADIQETVPEDDDGLLQDNQRDKEQNDETVEGEVAGEQGSGQDQNDVQLKPMTGSSEAENDGEADQSSAQQAASAGQGETNSAEPDDQAGPTEAPAAQQQQASSQLKQLGDVLEKFFRQNKSIESAQQSQETTDETKEPIQDLASAQFEHLADEQITSDAQAVGTGSMDQSKALPEEMSIPVDDQKSAEQLPLLDEASDVDQSDVQDAADRQIQQDIDTRALQGPQAFVGEGREYDDDIEMQDAEEDDVDESTNDMDLKLSKTHISNEERQTEMSIVEARQLWAQHEGNTRNLALILTEHLRLILQPTQATKMRGDFRTGKRLNIKKIIPYIASSYKRDKIWMRRTTPTKRNYQIMLAIDDSKSMAENDGKELAFSTLAMVTKSLSMLEAGELCVLSFGEDTTVAHDFSTPFTSDAGPEIFRSFSFDQGKTNVRKMLSQSIEMFSNARLRATGSASELWQLQIIISDGQCEDHPGIRQLVRQAQEERIMIVFIVVDAGYEGEEQQTRKSILDLPTAEFVKDENGEMQLKMSKYFDTFPFKYYLIVRNVLELPGVLAGALRQWFAEVVDTGF